MTTDTILQYIDLTMVRGKRSVPVRRLLITVLCFLVLGTLLLHGATSRDSFGIGLDAGWYGSIPSAFHQDDLPVRSHLTFGGTLAPSVFTIGPNQEISAGIATYYTTRSLVYGVTVWRPFLAIGPTVEYALAWDERFSTAFAISVMAGLYTQTLELHPMLRFTVSSGYALLPRDGKNRLILYAPVSLDVRKDYLSLTAGVGLKWRVAKRVKGAQP